MNITPSDIRNSSRQSGYDHVGKHRNGRFHAQAYGGRNNSAGHAFQGPLRRTALEAAQDFCDYINTGRGTLPATLKSAGHTGRRPARRVDEEEQAALGVLRDKRAQRSNQQPKGYVYCITDGTAVKIGYSLKPEARVAELQTGNPRPLKLLASKQGGLSDEKALHVKYLRHNLLQEWFRPTQALLAEFGLTKESLA